MSINPEANEFQSGVSFSLRGFGNKSIPSFNATELEYFGSWQLANNSQTVLDFLVDLHSHYCPLDPRVC